jgi:hypothetical protein
MQAGLGDHKGKKQANVLIVGDSTIAGTILYDTNILGARAYFQRTQQMPRKTFKSIDDSWVLNVGLIRLCNGFIVSCLLLA